MKKSFCLGAWIVVGVAFFLGTTSFAGQPLKKIRVADGVPDGAMVPRLLALEPEFLAKYGVEATPAHFPTTDVIAKALVTGDVQLSIASTNVWLNAIAAGQPLSVLAEVKKIDHMMLAPVSFKSLKDLDGKRVATHGPMSQVDAYLIWTQKKYGLKFQVVTIPGSEVRVQALSKGQIDASPIQLLEFIMLQKREPGKFHNLLSYMETDVLNMSVVGRTDWIAKNGDIVEGYLRSLLDVHRKANLAAFLKERAPKYLPGLDPEIVNLSIDENLKYKIFDQNLGLTEKSAAATVKFYLDAGILKQDIPTEKWTNMKFLNKILDETGRK